MSFQIKRPPRKTGEVRCRAHCSQVCQGIWQILLCWPRASVVSLGTDPWQQNITPILEGSEHIGQIFQQSEMFQAQLISPWDGGREQKICRHLFQVSLELGVSWWAQKKTAQHSTSTPKNINSSIQLQVIQVNRLWQDGSPKLKRFHHSHDLVEAKSSSQALPGRAAISSTWTSGTDSRKGKKPLIKHQAALSITMLSVNMLSRAPKNSGSCR